MVIFADVSLQAQSAKPSIASVENVASYAAGSVSPGEMVVIFGSGMGPSQIVGLQLDGQGKVANTLSGVKVIFDGATAPLIYVLDKQIVAMVPYSLAGRTTTQVQVSYFGNVSDSIEKSLSPSAPGIFTTDSSGIGQAAMTNSNGSLNGSANPANPGSFVTFYVTGEGQTNPPGSDGTIASGIANVSLPVTVSIAGRTLQVLYAGSAPGNVNGFSQVNAVIPSDLRYGGNLPLLVQVGGVSSQSGVTLAVSGPPAPIPGPPHNLSSSPNNSGEIILAWTPADGLAVRFHLERQVGGTGGFTGIGLVPVSVTTFSDSAVIAGVSYQYRVRAENDYGFSAYSGVATGIVPIPQLAPPSNLQASPASQTQINLTWGTANTNATKFHLERKAGATGVYAEVSVVPSTDTSYQDKTVQPNTTYTYRMRSEGSASRLSSFSGEATATTPASPLPPAPTLQGTAISFSQIRLSWSTTATAITLFTLERRTTTGVYSQFNQAAAPSTSLDDSGLNGSTTYLYRMRVLTTAGVSPYSNEVTVTTLVAPPAAPTNLQATAVSSAQINLTWTNNAPDATAIRVEYLPPGSAVFMDIFPAPTFTPTPVTNLQPNTTYSFRVRAQNATGYSGYSNVVTAITLSIPKTIFLVHGLNQTPLEMSGLSSNLGASYGLTPGRFRIDSRFDFSDCADSTLLPCSSSCTISGGAQRLAQYIANANPPGDIVLVGFSLGGLIARDLIANNRLVLSGRKIHLVTIGTPNLGYPYLATDSLVFCSAIVSAMYGDWRLQLNTVTLSTYLLSMTNQWSISGFPGTGRVWLTASGRAISAPTRLGEGCRDQNPYSDGVVCQDSAGYNVSTAAGTQPTFAWADPERLYVHSFNGLTSLILGNTNGNPNFLALWNPPPTGGLFAALTAVLNGL